MIRDARQIALHTGVSVSTARNLVSAYIDSVLKQWRAPKGVRPKIARQIVRTFVYVYAAVCMALGEMTSLILPYANTEMMNLFLEEVSRDFKDYFVIMLVDGAGWHRSGNLKIP